MKDQKQNIIHCKYFHCQWSWKKDIYERSQHPRHVIVFLFHNIFRCRTIRTDLLTKTSSVCGILGWKAFAALLVHDGYWEKQSWIIDKSSILNDHLCTAYTPQWQQKYVISSDFIPMFWLCSHLLYSCQWEYFVKQQCPYLIFDNFRNRWSNVTKVSFRTVHEPLNEFPPTKLTHCARKLPSLTITQFYTRDSRKN